jgi:hypothetical protein
MSSGKKLILRCKTAPKTKKVENPSPKEDFVGGINVKLVCWNS